MANTVTITPANGVVDILGKTYTVTAVVEHPTHGNVPVVDIPVMSDEKWRELAAKAKAQHPEYYKQAVMV